MTTAAKLCEVSVLAPTLCMWGLAGIKQFPTARVREASKAISPRPAPNATGVMRHALKYTTHLTGSQSDMIRVHAKQGGGQAGGRLLIIPL